VEVDDVLDDDLVEVAPGDILELEYIVEAECTLGYNIRIDTHNAYEESEIEQYNSTLHNLVALVVHLPFVA
jgi:hypothetical protein